jgi:chaperonin GroES
MASAAIEFDDTEIEVVDEDLTLAQLLTPGLNIATLLDDNELMKIGMDVVRDVETDETSRGDWLDRYQRSLDVAMQVKKAKNFPWPKAANIKYPLLTVASIQFQARAYPVIVDGSNLVKGRVLGPDPDGTKRARADRVGQHMTWQLLYRMPGWEEETDKLLLMLPITGCVFRKTYYDSIENANRSEIVSGENFIINYWAKSIESAPRYTQVLHYYPYEVKEFVAADMWLEVPFDDTDAGDDEQALGEYYEQHRCLDLDNDGYPEHYVVTCTKEGKVARIVPCYGLDTVTINLGGEMMKLDELLEKIQVRPEQYAEVADLLPEFKIVKIERRQYFTKYGFIPAPDGSFYDIGFGTLLDDISQTIDTTLNQMLDAGALQNAGGGFIGSGVNIRGGNFRFQLGEWKRVDSTGGPLRDNVLPVPAAGPSQALFNLLQMLISAAKEITAVQDVLTGQTTPNQTATTTLALIEQGQKVMTGIFKRIHRAFGQELRILRSLNRDYLDEEEYFQMNDSEEAVQIGRADYEDKDLDVVPVSDPGQVSDMQKMAKAEALMTQFNGDVLINQKQIREDFLVAVGAKDIPRYFEVPEPMPDPSLASKAALDEQAAKEKAAGAADRYMSAAEKAAMLGLDDDAAMLAGKATDDNASTGPGGIPGMEGEPADDGVLSLPEGPQGGFDGGMGIGQPMGEPTGNTGPSSFDGAVV